MKKIILFSVSLLRVLFIANFILCCSLMNHVRKLKEHIFTLQKHVFDLHHHFMGEDNIVSCCGVKFFVPNFPEDLLQRTIVATGNFQEISILKQLDGILPEQAVIFDVGANIGNHSLYWTKKRNAKKVYAFEPLPEVFKILEKNIQLNHAENIVSAYNVAISDHSENLAIEEFDPQNIGGTSLKKSVDGSLKAIDLDHFEFPEQIVDFVKIDVEGFECNVLKGAISFLKKYTPKSIFIEIFTCSKQKFIENLLFPLGYELRQEFPGHNFLYQLKC